MRTLACFAFFSATAVALHAELRLPRLLSDHAVLQRDAPLHVWGWATPGATIQIKLHGQATSVRTSGLGQWSAYLAPEPAGGPYTLTLDGDGHRELTDILIGDLWIASGQSNMEMPLKGFDPDTPIRDSAKEIAAASNPRLRLLIVDKKGSTYPLDDVPNPWTTCTPETAANFSAVAYFFGREIAAKENVPIGLIDSTWGGTPADSWISMTTLGSDPALLPAFAARARFAENYARKDAEVAQEKAEEAAAKAAGKPAPPHDWHPAEESWLPAGLYNGMIAPLTPLSAKGFLWYQGETNSGKGRAPYYATLFPALIRDWRMHFAQGDLPFLFVQISSFSSPREDWGTIRDAQRRTLFLRNTAMVVTLDSGEPHNVHPADKQTVGARLALAARGTVYGEQIAHASPLFRQATVQNGAIRVWFDNANGLSAHGLPLSDFEIAGEDHNFIPATAKLEGETVVVSSPGLPAPRYVRYGWAGVVTAYLYNSAGLPASTFTSEPAPADTNPSRL